MSLVVRFHKTGGPEVLEVEDINVRAPMAQEVRIKVKALGLNRAEVMYRNGQYVIEPRFPAILGYEAAGCVESVGTGVTEVRAGDIVSVVPAFSFADYGLYGELVNVPVHAVVKHPATLTFEEAAASWMMFITAYGALIDIAKLGSGDTVLIGAASSSVGLAAIQLANLVGATPIALTRTSKKRQALIEAGAKHVIAIEEQDLVSAVLEATNGDGARVAFDPVGGAGTATILKCLCKYGIFFQYGALSTDDLVLPVMDVLGKNLTIRGYELFEVTSDKERINQAKHFILSGLESGKLKPLIARTFPLGQIGDAHRYMESNEQIGKIVVTV
jgi:NADPH:quinone reductase-like Zn-dependent oxidoreductase